jgi:hypothetical protein
VYKDILWYTFCVFSIFLYRFDVTIFSVRCILTDNWTSFTFFCNALSLSQRWEHWCACMCGMTISARQALLSAASCLCHLRHCVTLVTASRCATTGVTALPSPSTQFPLTFAAAHCSAPAAARIGSSHPQYAFFYILSAGSTNTLADFTTCAIPLS